MMNPETTTREAPDLAVIHERLRDIYRAEYPEGAPHLYEQLLPRLPDYIRALVRRKLDLLVQTATEGHERGKSGRPGKKIKGIDSFEQLTNGDKEALAMFLDPQVLRAHLDVGRDSALSNDHHSIAHTDTQPPIVAHKLISVASSNEHAQKLERMGCVFFDVDGTKTIVDCTSHSHAGKYLEGLAEFLSKLPEQVQQWLRERRLRTEAFSVAGDEFVVTLRSEDDPITKETLDSFAVVVQEALKTDPVMTSFISFDDPEFAMEYDEWTDAERSQYKADRRSMAERLRASRDKLPDRFIPSVSCGSATFLEALQEALSPDTEEAKTLEELGINTFRLMVAKADERLKQDKRVFREKMDDPKWKAFLLRNTENRRLENENTVLRKENERLQHENELLRRENQQQKELIATYERAA